MKAQLRLWIAGAAVAASGLVWACMPSSAEPLRVGKPQSAVFSFVPLDVGIQAGIFKKHGIDVQELNFGGAAKLQQALAAQAIDVGLGSGPALAFIARGAPQRGIAAMAGPPLVMTLIVAKDGQVQTIGELKGKTVSISSPGGVPEWVVRELSRKEGWGPAGISMVGLGADPAQLAALRTGQVVGMPTDIGIAMKLQDQGVARILVRFGDIVPTFIMHVIFAGNEVIDKRPTICASSSPAGSRPSDICADTRPTRCASARRLPACRLTSKAGSTMR